MADKKILTGTRKIPVANIKVGTRRREDMGDIQGLADSMEKYGLIHPIVVDDVWNLVTGGRRLEAAKLLGWEEIEVRFTEELDEDERRVLELEENIKRKDLTEYEKSRNMVEWAEITRRQAKEESACTPGVQAPSNIKGVTVPGSYRDISERIGIPVQTIRDAEDHVEAVNKYPELKDLPKKEAIKQAKELDGQTKPAVTRNDIRQAQRYVEAVQKYPDLATYSPGQAIAKAKERDKNNKESKTEKDFIDLMIKLTELLTNQRSNIESYINSIDSITLADSQKLERLYEALIQTAELLKKIIKKESDPNV